MNATSTQSATIEHILQEHNALREKLQRIHSVLAEPEPAQEEIENLLHDFLSTLMVHFANEEGDGFFAEITAHAPRLAAKSGKLCTEHRQLLHEAGELCRFAAAGSPSMVWWRELKCRTQDFCDRMRQHEREENGLLQEAHQTDIGAYD
jgi:hypothetical protein